MISLQHTVYAATFDGKFCHACCSGGGGCGCGSSSGSGGSSYSGNQFI